jgi:hypothetical protein
MEKDKMLIKMFQLLNIDIKEISDVNGIQINRDKLKENVIIENYKELIPKLKEFYNSSMFNCLHENSFEKQKQPAVCMLRQILKANNFKMVPRLSSQGYDKTNGKKIVNRYYLVEKNNYS